MKKLHCLIVIGFFFITSCDLGPIPCDDWANGYRDESECNLIISKIERNGSLMYIDGKDVNTGNDTEFYEGSGWISEIYHQFKTGDTIVKQKGSYLTTIKRKNKIIVIPLKCPDTRQIYTDHK